MSDTRPNVELREVGPDDWELFRLVRLRALEDAPDAFSTLLSEWQGDGDREERWRARLDGVPFNLIAVVDGRPVGQVSGPHVDDSGSVELISMWVAPEARRTGIGRVLVEAVVMWAESSGARVVTLAVKHGNSPAIALYERAGFIDQGVRPDASDERLMTRALPTSAAP